MGIWLWSKTAASNDTADPDINWRERMAPSQVNNSGRGLMAGLAEYRDDMSGAIETAGANSAYTVASFSGVVDGETDYLDNVCIAFVPHLTNAANPTLNVDSGGALPLRGAPGVALAAGVLIEGTPYVALLNPGKTEWLIHGYRNEPTTIPLGGFLPYVASSAPNSNFVLPYGQAISRTTYAALFTLIGTTFGVGDGTATFNVPDLRNRTIFGLGNMGGGDLGLITVLGSGIDGTSIGAKGGAQNVTVARANLPDDTVSVAIVDPGHHHQIPIQNAGAIAASGSGRNSIIGVDNDTTTSTTGISGSIALNGGVTQTPVNKMPPAIVLPYIMRVQ